MAESRDVKRHRLLREIESDEVRFVALFAAAGYGKTTLARQYAARFEHAVTCDLSGIETLRDFAQRVAVAVASEPETRAQAALPVEADLQFVLDFAHHLWESAEAALVVFENAEALSRINGAEAELARFLQNAPGSRRVCICSRVQLQIPFLRFALPHEVVAFDERSLAFDYNEIALTSAASTDVAKIYEVTQGWPLCVRLVARLAESGSLDKLMREMRAVNFSLLHEYLINNVIEVIDAFARSVVIALASAELTDGDIRRIFRDDDARAMRIITASPFVINQGGQWLLHTLIRTSIQYRYSSETRDVLRLAADRALAEDRIRAGVLYARLGDFEAAACALEPLVLAWVQEPLDAEFSAVMQQMPRNILLRHARLFSAAMLFAGLTVSAEERLSNASLIKERFDGSEDQGTRVAVDVTIANALTNLGRHEEALTYITPLAADDEPNSQLYYHVFYGSIRSRMGCYEDGFEHWPPAKNLARNAPSTLAIMANEVLVRGARCRGEFENERVSMSFSLMQARISKNSNAYAFTLTEGIFGAWFRGDDETFNSLVAELEQLRFPSVMPGTRLFRACVMGVFDDLAPDVGRPQLHAYAYLIGLGALRGDLQRTVALSAIDASDRAREPFLQCISRVALSLVDSNAAPRAIYEAKRFAEQVDSGPLRDAVQQLEHGEVRPLFTAFASHITGMPYAPEGYRVSLFDQKLYSGHALLHPSKREFELLAFLAYRDGEVSKDELAEAFAPDAPSDDADRLIRVVVARIRKKFGTDLLVSARGKYALGPNVDVPLRNLRARIARCQTRPELSPNDRIALQHDLLAIEKYLDGRRPDYEWGGELDNALERLAESIRLTVMESVR